MTRSSTLISAMLLIGLLAGCAGGPNLPLCEEVETSLRGYELGGGDQIRLTVFRHEDLSGEFALDGEGTVALPLAGDIDAGGMTTRELEDAVEQRLASEGFLVNPQISIEVLTFRPFYILGEVNQPGEYEYTNAMTVTNAVALAGGYGYRAAQDDIVVQRGDCMIPGNPGVRVLPGDILTVPERFF